MHKIAIFWFILISLLSTNGFAQKFKIGDTAPDFTVKSGSNSIVNLKMNFGKTVFLFYETKDVVEKNRKLKQKLNEFYNIQPDSIKRYIERLTVIDCTSAFWPFTGIWESKLVENSIIEEMTLYGDWDGKMKRSYSMKNNESNIFVIDKKGIIRYVNSGRTNDDEIGRIIKLLNDLGNEK
ncbi:MAG: redoxin domain-containing protein [Fibrobacter sp.]|nr:redoxin domain-containing protein [Fibrobacter sp.]